MFGVFFLVSSTNFMWATTLNTNLLLSSEIKKTFNISHVTYKACENQLILNTQGSKAGTGPLVTHFPLFQPAFDWNS